MKIVVTSNGSIKIETDDARIPLFKNGEGVAHDPLDQISIREVEREFTPEFLKLVLEAIASTLK